MNKYSKAVKTAATVGMSLAMVLSAAPVTQVEAKLNVGYVCDDTTVAVYNDLIELFEGDYENTSFYETGVTSTNEKTSVMDYFKDATYGATRLNEVKKLAGAGSFNSCTDDETIIAAAQYIVDAYEALYSLTEDAQGDLEAGDTRMVGVLDIADARIANKTYTAEKIAENNELFDNVLVQATFLQEVLDNYSGNLENDVYNKLVRVEGILTDMMEEARPDWEYRQQKELVLEMEKAVKEFIKYETVTKENDDKKRDDSITRDEVTQLIRAITKKGVTYPGVDVKWDFISKYYNTYKNNEDVEAIMDYINGMYDEIKEMRAILNRRTNDVYADFLKAAKKYKTTDDVKEKLTFADYELYKAFKEEVLDKVVTINVKEYSKFYAASYDKSIYVTTAEMEQVLADFGAELFGKLLAFDDEEGTFTWDDVVAHMDEAIANFDALTTGIEDLEAISLVADDKDAVVAADDALYFFEDEAVDGHTHLTKEEAREVRDNRRKVTELFEAYRKEFGSVNTELNGWVNKGNGDYNYFEEGKAVTKWVASGKNWYYVQDGVMLRNSWVAQDARGNVWYYVGNDGAMVTNTTIDGCYINSFGAWTK